MASLIKCRGIKGNRWCDDPMQPPENFSKQSANKSGHKYYCKTCESAHYKKNYCPDRRRDRGLQLKYGITSEDYDALLDIQEGGCKICGWVPPEGKNLSVDHCHDTGEVRGLLCQTCNTVLGNARDNQAVLFSAIAYLEHTASAKEPDPVWHPNPLVTEDPEAYFDVSEVLDIICLRAEGEDLI